MPGCRPGVVAAGPRDRGVLNTRHEKWTHRESHPDLRFAGPASSCWTMSPFVSGSRGTRTHKRVSPATCFQDRFLIRPDDLQISACGMCTHFLSSDIAPRRKIAGVGIEPTPSWFRARRCYQQQPPRSVVSKLRLAISEKVRGEGFEPPSPGSKAGSLPLADPRSL